VIERCTLVDRGHSVVSIAGSKTESSLVRHAQADIIRMVNTEGWREFLPYPNFEEVVTHERFEDWVTAFPFKGLGMTLEDLKVIAQGSIEALDAIDRATSGRHGGDHTSEESKGNNVPLAQPKGNSTRRALRRLRTEGERGNDQAADLHRQLLAGQVSANAAMIQAGFRKRSKSYTGEPLERARKAFQDLTEEERRAFLKGA